MDEETLDAAVTELREAGWTVTEPEPEKVVDDEGDTWIRFEDGYRIVRRSEPGVPLNDIRRAYGIRSQA